ncbi:ABC transporter ATP-binding protein [Legionella longbeachae]|uniref:ABC transporter ATP-binding protein n=1 Tax=Legionella longbeachae TaxID=450 RepID=UPI0001BEC481|nr:ABC transporter ATP-binding protein [Legionella longbeachae]VEE04025.1 Capsule polysaccharide export ATP-binding protein ctrD (Capsular-polysaccharide-transporting ATPase) [Legionella oakridgensis]ARB93122.1 ABC transporter ATP-binding protein [Legionella longbeachae]ARM33815.1 ABC transporter ATP-binding protein [Legionella longbeachae]EEZ97009.1 polysialic acid transport ATP-binding protein [Legionella longbeachae D-4968]QEY52864.1 ABC transporter ATP-binding protein [Legionella longbeach
MIHVENLTKIYSLRHGPRTVIDNISFTIQPGKKLGILGRNGAGKSTLIRLISGAERPTKGKIKREMSVSWPLAFGGAFQGNQSGLDCLKFVCRVYGLNAKEKIPFVEDFTELGKYLREPIKSYSSGMRARLAFAVSMAVEFDCFLIDEVVAVGDSRFHDKCRFELFEKRKDRSLIIVSHDSRYIKDHCDSAAVLLNGKLYAFENIGEAYEFYNKQT